MSYKSKSRAGFTLVELLVVIVIISILAGLSLAGLAGLRARSREEATRTTIRKIHEIIVPQYEGYLDKRLDRDSCITIGNSSPPSVVGPRRKFEWGKLVTIRKTLAFDMPDNWDDVSGMPGNYKTPRTDAYNDYGGGSSSYGSAECLYMICLLSGFRPEAMENFRAEEIGDKDEDGKPEFHDAWGMPIAFIRWPTGFSGPITLNQGTQDPFDPETVDSSRPPQSAPAASIAYGVVPLIYSAGLDQEYGLDSAQAAGFQSDANVGNFSLVTATLGGHFASPLPGNASQDNISNHDLITR